MVVGDEYHAAVMESRHEIAGEWMPLLAAVKGSVDLYRRLRERPDGPLQRRAEAERAAVGYLDRGVGGSAPV